jgi:hypothetical protein
MSTDEYGQAIRRALLDAALFNGVPRVDADRELANLLRIREAADRYLQGGVDFDDLRAALAATKESRT